jgi:hypothetical protein
MSILDISKLDNTGKLLDIESFKYILVIVFSVIGIVVNSINLYTGNRRSRIFGLLYLAIILYYLFILYKKVIVGLILD